MYVIHLAHNFCNYLKYCMKETYGIHFMPHFLEYRDIEGMASRLNDRNRHTVIVLILSL